MTAVEHGRVVGVGWIVLAAVNDSYLVEVHVSPGQRRRGVGTALVAAVCRTADEPFPVRGRVMSSQPWRREFADALGCVVRMSCPEPWIDPTSAAAQAWVAQQPVPARYAIRPLAEVERSRVVDAWVAYVEWVHRPFGAVRPGRVRAEWESYAAGLDAQLSMVATDQAGAVVAFSLVTPDGWLGRTFVVSETTDPDQPDGSALLRATVAASVRALGRRGVRAVELEGHSSDPHSPALVRSLPPGGGDPMDLVELVAPTYRSDLRERLLATV